MQNVNETFVLAQNNLGGRENEASWEGTLSQSTKAVTLWDNAFQMVMVTETLVCMGENMESKNIWLALTKKRTLKVMTSEYCTEATTEESGH